MDLIFQANVFDNVIVNYLKMKDLFNLKFVCQVFRRKFTDGYLMKRIKKIIENRLKVIFGSTYNEFVVAMFKSKAILSGSFVLQCIIGEQWDNSDIDIYVSSKQSEYQSSNLPLHKYLLTQIETAKDKELSYGNYNSVYERIIDCVTNYKNCGPMKSKIQVVRIETSKKYSLIDHTYNTGFDVCKNRLYYDKNGKIHLYLKNYKEAINKSSTFTIENVNDFFYRIEKYSKRGFFFKPKYDRLLYLEFLYLKFSHDHIIKTSFDEDTYVKLYHTNKLNCGVNCPVKLLYRNVRHYHLIEQVIPFNEEDDEDYGIYIDEMRMVREMPKYVVVDNHNKEFNNILPELMYYDEDKLRDLRRNIIYSSTGAKCIDDYVKVRNKYAKRKINIYNNGYKYDVQYGLPCIHKEVKQVTEFVRKDAKTWTTVKSKYSRKRQNKTKII